MVRSSLCLEKSGNLRRHLSWTAILTLIFLATLAQPATAQQAAADSLTGSAVCTFDDGKELSARYKPVPVSQNESAPAGKVWAPGGLAMTLFTEGAITLGTTTVPAGAYTMYLLPGKKEWTLIVSRNLTLDGKYDQNQDLARATMQTGDLGRSEGQFKVFFGHIAPKRCEFNVDYGKSRAWVDFAQK